MQSSRTTRTNAGDSDIATIGDVNISRPGLLDFTGKAKWYVQVRSSKPTIRTAPSIEHIPVSRDAWKGVEGTSKEDAQAKYVEKLLEVRLRFDSIIATDMDV